MKRSVMHVLAGLAGFVMGWALTTSPMAWGLAGTRVTWDASSCPAGIYTITSMARSAENGRTHVTSSDNITLPSPTVVQEFSGLPAGTFSVTAVARRSDGAQFESSQTIVSAGDGVIVPPPDSSSSTVRRRPPASDAASSRARPRAGRDNVRPPPGVPPTPSAAGTTRIETVAKANEGRSLRISKSDLEYIRIQLNDGIDPASADLGWRRISLIDSDADGLTDVVIVEMTNGDVRLWYLGPAR